MKLRSSWKGKDKNARKNEVASEPVSPDQAQHRFASPVRALNAKEREELATINKSLADDSFFQISLTSDTPNTTVLNGEIFIYTCDYIQGCQLGTSSCFCFMQGLNGIAEKVVCCFSQGNGEQFLCFGSHIANE